MKWFMITLLLLAVGCNPKMKTVIAIDKVERNDTIPLFKGYWYSKQLLASKIAIPHITEIPAFVSPDYSYFYGEKREFDHRYLSRLEEGSEGCADSLLQPSPCDFSVIHPGMISAIVDTVVVRFLNLKEEIYFTIANREGKWFRISRDQFYNSFARIDFNGTGRYHIETESGKGIYSRYLSKWVTFPRKVRYLTPYHLYTGTAQEDTLWAGYFWFLFRPDSKAMVTEYAENFPISFDNDLERVQCKQEVIPAGTKFKIESQFWVIDREGGVNLRFQLRDRKGVLSEIEEQDLYQLLFLKDMQYHAPKADSSAAIFEDTDTLRAEFDFVEGGNYSYLYQYIEKYKMEKKVELLPPEFDNRDTPGIPIRFNSRKAYQHFQKHFHEFCSDPYRITPNTPK